jgi:hypothetical protein
LHVGSGERFGRHRVDHRVEQIGAFDAKAPQLDLDPVPLAGKLPVVTGVRPEGRHFWGIERKAALPAAVGSATQLADQGLQSLM